MGIFNSFYDYLFVKNVKKPNLGEDLRLVVQSSDFDDQLRSSGPFLTAGIVAWPSYWLFRGYEWQKYRQLEPLPLYIRKTFYRAKAMEFGILCAGIMMAFISTNTNRHTLEDVKYKK